MQSEVRMSCPSRSLVSQLCFYILYRNVESSVLFVFLKSPDDGVVGVVIGRASAEFSTHVHDIRDTGIRRARAGR